LNSKKEPNIRLDHLAGYRDDLDELKNALDNYHFKQDSRDEALYAAGYSHNFHAVTLLTNYPRNPANPNAFRRAISNIYVPLVVDIIRLYSFSESDKEKEAYAVCDAFLNNGFDPNLLPKNCEEAALSCAGQNRWKSVVRLLLNAGADPNLVVRRRSSAETIIYKLLDEVKDEADAIEIVTILMAHGLNINCPSGYSLKTPLLQAVDGNFPLLVEFLLEQGADINAKDKSGDTAIQIACDYGYGAIQQILYRYGATIDRLHASRGRLRAAVREENWRCVIDEAENVLLPGDKDNERLYYLISSAYAQLGDQTLAYDWARRGMAESYSERLLERLITSLALLQRDEEALALWQQYKPELESGSVEPQLLANIIAVTERQKGYQACIDEFAPWVEENTDTDQGMISLNMACIYSLADQTNKALQYLERAMENGCSDETIEKEPQLKVLRDLPIYATLKSCMREKILFYAGCKPGEPENLIELVVRWRSLVIRKYNLQVSDTAAEVTEEEFDTYLATAEACQKAGAKLDEEGFLACTGAANRYWPQKIIQTCEAWCAAQQQGNLPALGAMIVEWDFGDDEGEHNFWFGACQHNPDEKPEETFLRYVYGDNVLCDDTDAGPPVDHEEQFGSIIKTVTESDAFRRLNKQSPFYFCYQEHDSGPICHVRV